MTPPRVLAFDLETHLIQPGQLFPKLVCLSWASRVVSPDVATAAVVDRTEGLAKARVWLNDPGVILVGHNVSFDLGVLAAEDPSLLGPIFAAVEAGRVRDTQVRQKLLDIAAGTLKFSLDAEGGATKTGHSLADLAARLLGRHLEKADTWRLRYAELDGVPLDRWPAEAVRYAQDDAATTLDVYEAQQRILAEDGLDEVPDERRQTMAAWALHLMSGWGIRTDGAAAAQLRETLEAEQAAAVPALLEAGIVRLVKGKPTRDIKKIRALVEAAYATRGEAPPMTEKGSVKTDEATLLATGDPGLLVLAQSLGGGKLLSTYVPILEAGAEVPITARFNGLVESGRTSCSGPNLQNPPRKGGVRECFVPRPGYVFCSVDYDTIELRALAEICLALFGRSEMAAALHRGEDLHSALGAEILGISYDEFIARLEAGDPEAEAARQDAKGGNFGFPGGMGAAKFLVLQAEAAARQADPAAWAKGLRDAWLRRWPEMAEFFAYNGGLTGPGGSGKQVHYRSGRVRDVGEDYCSAANGWFQGLTADGAKASLWAVSRACYTEPASPLYGSRPVVFLHDEIIAEVPEDRAHEAATEMARIMISVMAEWIPSVPITAKPTLTRRWWKGAKPVYVDGRLVPSRPEKTDKGTIWVPDNLTTTREAA